MKPLIGLTPKVEHSGKDFWQREATLSVNYTEAIKAAGGIPVILPLTADPTTLQELMNRCAGILIPGGGDMAANFYHPKMDAKRKQLLCGVDEVRDLMELFLARAALASSKPIFGICRGVQLMNVASGGSLIADIPTQIAGALAHQRKKGEAEHEIQIESGSRLCTLFSVRELRVNSDHHQAIDQVGRGFRVTARALDGIVEAIEKPTHPFALGVQFHPERMFRQQPKFLRLFEAFVRAATGYANQRGNAGR